METPNPYTMRGFTLIELLVVVAIMAITLGFGVPAFKVAIDSNRLTSAANDMVVALQTARSAAIKNVKNAGVSIATDGQSWYAFLNSSTLTGSPPPGTLLQTYTAPQGITLDTSDYTPTYKPDGRLDSVAAITVDMTIAGGSTGGEQRTLTIQPSGLVSITVTHATN